MMNYLFLLFSAVLFTETGLAQTPVDSNLLAIIYHIQAIDNHCHDEGMPEKLEFKYDHANPLGHTNYPETVTIRLDNPELIQAWRELYDYGSQDTLALHLNALIKTKEALMRKLGDSFPSYILKKMNIEIACVNNNHLGFGQVNRPAFRWVPFGDPLLYPLSSKDKGPFETLGWDGWNKTELLQAVHMNKLPATLTDYLQQLVLPLLEQYKLEKVFALKFAVAYLRPLYFEKIETAQAELVYEKYLSVGNPPEGEYKKLQDYIFWYIAQKAGDLGIAIQFHTGNGEGPFFNNMNANPGLLENVINDPLLQHTHFVLVHGGYPFYLEAQVMTDKPNTWLDISAQSFYLTSHGLSQILRSFLEWQPEHVLFGTDAGGIGADAPLFQWEELAWLSNHTARLALAEALTAMLRDKEITRDRAIEVAHLVLHDNAAKLYGLSR